MWNPFDPSRHKQQNGNSFDGYNNLTKRRNNTSKNQEEEVVEVAKVAKVAKVADKTRDIHMQSSQAITDYRMLPRPCLCSKPTGLPYSQRLRIDRSCMSNVITYDVSSCTVDVSGSGYVTDDILQIVGGFPEKQTGSITVTASSGAVISADISGNFAFTTKPTANPVSTTFLRGTGTGPDGSGATFTIVWKTNNSGCCSCN